MWPLDKFQTGWLKEEMISLMKHPIHMEPFTWSHSHGADFGMFQRDRSWLKDGEVPSNIPPSKLFTSTFCKFQGYIPPAIQALYYTRMHISRVQ
jgi:hypothetical protein